jgi:hypothetical protein
MTRPDDPFSPDAVWHELQSPTLTEATIALSLPPYSTFTENGSFTGLLVTKLPAELIPSVSVFPSEPVKTIAASGASTPSQSSKSCAAA